MMDTIPLLCMNTGDNPSSKVEDVIDILTKALPQYGDQLMTFAQQLEQRDLEIDKNMLRDNEPVGKIC